MKTFLPEFRKFVSRFEYWLNDPQFRQWVIA